MRVALALGAFVAAALPASAQAPQVTAVTGSTVHHGMVSVTGANFGTKATAVPYKWDDMNGSHGSELDVRGWLVHQNTPRPTLSSTTELRATPGRTTSAYLHQTGGNVPAFGFGDNGQNYLSLTPASALNLRALPPGFVLLDYWMYFVDSTVSNNYKILRWHSLNDPSGAGNRYLGFPLGAHSGESSSWEYWSELGPVDLDQRWSHVQVWLNWSPTQAQNFYKLAVNGRVWYDSDGAGNYVPQDAGLTAGPWTPLSAGDRLSSFLIEHQDGTDGSPTRDGHMTISDVAVDSGVGAVYLGNASTYAASTHTEYQPYTSWSPSGITVTLNWGTFVANANVYLFVVTNGRQVSAGFPVTLGNAQPGAIDCVVSPFVLTSAGPWSTCVNGVQTRTETWTRTVITPPSNGGLACPPLTETRIGTQSCVVIPPAVGCVDGGVTYAVGDGPAMQRLDDGSTSQRAIVAARIRGLRAAGFGVDVTAKSTYTQLLATCVQP
jgi:hypothetical protein